MAIPNAPEVIILTGQGDPDGAELAIKGGVWDYILKPSSVREIALTLSRALKYRKEKTKRQEEQPLDLSSVVGVSPGRSRNTRRKSLSSYRNPPIVSGW